MKLFHISLFIMIAFAAAACGNNPSNAAIESETGTAVEVKNESETSESSSIAGNNENFTINDRVAGPFALDATIPDGSSYRGYELVKDLWASGPNDETPIITSYTCMKDGERHLVLIPGNESGGGSESVISEILVYSDLYKTEAGIGVGNTIEEFYSNYSDARAFHSFVRTSYWLEMGDMPSVQFMMNSEDTEEPDYDMAIMEIFKSSFKKGAEIQLIRVH